jgi:hypothetical protein
MIQTRRLSPRAEYRMRESQRIKDSISIAEKYPKLKSLTIDLEYFDSEGVTRNGGMKYKANLDNAKSVFCFNCPNWECVGGDFDLSVELARAISGKRKIASGEKRCQGQRHNKERKDRVPCLNILRYKLTLGY